MYLHIFSIELKSVIVQHIAILDFSMKRHTQYIISKNIHLKQ